MESSIRTQTSFVYQVAPKDLVCIQLEDPDRTYFPGERITGHVQIGMKHGTNSRVAIHLACTAKLGTQNLPLFKIPDQPTHLSAHTTHMQIPFSIMVPGDVPSSVDHPRVPGKIEYKVKAVHELNDLPSCIWPKASTIIRVHERISTVEDRYIKGMTSEGKLSFNIPHDITLKHLSFRKGEHKTASAWLHIPGSCYLPDQSVPFTLRVQHFAPIRQMEGGVTAYLERITKTVCDMENSIDTVTIAQCILPLSCDPDDYRCKFTSNGLKIPKDTPPTLDRDQYPLQVSYRIRVVVSLDMDGLQLRKRDKMATYMGMIKMKFNEEEGVGGSTIVLDIPIKVGTTKEELPPSPRSISSFKSLFDGGYGFFQQDERGMIPPSPMLGPPPAYNVAVNSSNEINNNNNNNNNSLQPLPSTPPLSTIVTLRQLTVPYDSTLDLSSNGQQQRFVNSNNNDTKKSPSMLLSTPLQPPQSLLLAEGLITRQPSAPNLQDLESPIPLPHSALQHRFSDNMIPDATFASKPSIHARSWSVPADKHNPKYPSAQQQQHQHQHQHSTSPYSQPQQQHSQTRSYSSAPPLPSQPQQLPPQYLYHNPPPVPNHHHLYHLPQQQHHNPHRHPKGNL